MKRSRRGWVLNSARGDQDASWLLAFSRFVSAASGFRSPWLHSDSAGRDEGGFDYGVVVDSRFSGGLMGFVRWVMGCLQLYLIELFL